MAKDDKQKADPKPETDEPHQAVQEQSSIPDSALDAAAKALDSKIADLANGSISHRDAAKFILEAAALASKE